MSDDRLMTNRPICEIEAPSCQQTEDLRITSMTPLVAPGTLKARLPLNDAMRNTVIGARAAIRDILTQRDSRLLIIIGPCSIHDVAAAYDYAERLNRLRVQYADRLLLVMRTYFEKPRTTVGWRGLINDPRLDGSCDMEAGLVAARELLLRTNALGLPTAVEMLDTITPHYFADLVSFSTIGARTAESQPHRAMASGLSMPIGFKNGTDGSIQIAIDALVASRAPQNFLGIDQQGHCVVAVTSGNDDGTLILRGGKSGTNYHATAILDAREQLRAAHLPDTMIVDCSHANSRYRPEEQELAWTTVLRDRDLVQGAVVGMMVESNLHAGRQPFSAHFESLQYGVSVTDGCIDWPTTERLLEAAYVAME